MINLRLSMSEDPALREVERLRHRIFVLALAYYRLDESVVSDHVFDALGLELMEKNPDFRESGILWEYFTEWQGSPSAHLLPLDPDVWSEAIHLTDYLRKHRGQFSLIGAMYRPYTPEEYEQAKLLALSRSSHSRMS